MNYTYHLKISNDLIVDSISTMAKILKLLDQHISDLGNQQRQQLVQELDTFYNHAEAVTKSQFVYFNKLSFIPRCATMVEIS